MTFLSPEWLFALLALPPAAAALAVWARQRRRLAHVYADPSLLDVRPPRRVLRLRAAAAVLGLLAVACGAVAMARPAVERTAQERRPTLVIALDTSKSMRIADVAPDRLEAAREAVRRLLSVAPREAAIGLIAFSDRAQTLVVPGTDRDAVRRALGRLEIREGTAIGDAVVAGVDLLRAVGALAPAEGTGPAPGRILLLTDGAQSAGDVRPRDAGERARAARVPVSAVLLGDDPGRPGEEAPAVTLASLARQTGGVFTRSSSAAELRRVFEDIGATLATVRRRDELTVDAALAMLVLMAAAGAALGAARIAPSPARRAA